MTLSMDGFEAASKQQWKEAATKELKGKPYEENLIKHYLNDVSLEAYQNNEDLNALPIPVAEVQNAVQFFAVAQTHKGYRIPNMEEQRANAVALAVLKQGASALFFETTTETQYSTLLQGIQQDLIAFSFPYLGRQAALDTLEQLGANTQVSFVWDAQETEFTADQLKTDLQALSTAAKAKSITIGFYLSLDRLTSAGANFSLQLSACQAIYHDVVLALAPTPELLNHVSFHLPQNVLLLPEIAKMRALAWMQGQILVDHNLDLENIQYPGNFISFNPVYLGKQDPPTNLIRLSSFAFGAFACNPGVIALQAYCEDATVEQHQISASINTILEEESHANHYLDPAAGSFYLEALTQKLVESTEALSKKLPVSWVDMRDSEYFQKQLKEQAERLQQSVAEVDFKMIGENQYPPEGKEAITELQLNTQA